MEEGGDAEGRISHKLRPEYLRTNVSVLANSYDIYHTFPNSLPHNKMTGNNKKSNFKFFYSNRMIAVRVVCTVGEKKKEHLY